MPSTDAQQMGARIAEARGRAGLTQVQLATATSLERSALAKIENGSRRITALELARIAEAVDERIEWFVTDAAAAIVSHRNNTDPGAASPAIDRLVERTTRNVEFLADHDTQFAVGDLAQLGRPANADDAESAARKARNLLGVGADEPLIGLADLAARAGILAFSFDLGTDAADAASILLAHGAVVVVNGALQVGRRRLALAHDIGHCVFADEYTIDWNSTDRDDSGTWEARLDRFGRALLLPAEELQRSWLELQARDDTRTAAVKVASRFRVDMSTLARRLLEVGQVDAAEAHVVRTTRTTRADIVELDLLVHAELEAPDLPRVYEQSVLRLYRSATVSSARATDLLFDLWTEEDLPVLPTAPPEAIWGLVH
jgi:Zn-dependent peptidase ImmA (M78 family)/transcriptional regulator with XRE-family HTH domain